jgi:hypothetical protein
MVWKESSSAQVDKTKGPHCPSDRTDYGWRAFKTMARR